MALNVDNVLLNQDLLLLTLSLKQRLIFLQKMKGGGILPSLVITDRNFIEMVMPGDNLKFEVELIAPIAMEEKLRFAIREGGRTVGAGVVSKIIK